MFDRFKIVIDISCCILVLVSLLRFGQVGVYVYDINILIHSMFIHLSSVLCT